MRVLMITSEWPSINTPFIAPFVVQQYNKLIENHISVDIIHVKGNGNPFCYIKNWLIVRKVLKNGNYNIVHAQWAQSALSAIPLFIPLVVTYRGDDLEGIINNKGKHGIASYILRFLSKSVSLFSDHNIIVSSHFKSKLWSKNTPLTVIPSGIDFSMIPKINKKESRIKWNYPLDKTIVIFPNKKSVYRKRFDLVERCIQLLPEEYKDKIILKVAYGFDRTEIMEQMIASDFLIFASMHEGSPNIIKEAIACNLPIISVDVADVKSRISHIPGCFLVNSYDPQDLSNALLNALKYDYSHYSSIDYIKNLDENILVTKLIDIYKSLI